MPPTPTTDVPNRGWLVTISATIALLMLGALYAWSVVKKAIPAEWGWSEADKMWPYSVCLIFFSIFMVVGGRIQDKRGPRLVITMGGIAAGLGLIICGLSTNPLMWYLGFGVFLGIGIGLAYSSGTPPALKWFPASKTGLISGIVVAGFGGGAIWVAPTLRALIASVGIQTTMIYFGIAVTVVMVFFAQFVKAPPAGYVPVDKGAKKAGTPAPRPVVDWPSAEMVRTWQFPVMVACFAFGGGAGLVVIGNMASIVTSFGLETYSAIAVSVLAFGNGLGRVIYGKLSDMYGRKPVLTVAFALQAVLIVVLTRIGVADYEVVDGVRRYSTENPTVSVALISVIVWLIGANYGATLSVFPALTKDFFGLRNYGSNYGLVYQGWGIGGFIVSQIAAYLIAGQKDADNIYSWAYYWVIAILVVGVGLMLAMKAPTKASEKVPAPVA